MSLSLSPSFFSAILNKCHVKCDFFFGRSWIPRFALTRRCRIGPSIKSFREGAREADYTEKFRERRLLGAEERARELCFVLLRFARKLASWKTPRDQSKAISSGDWYNPAIIGFLRRVHTGKPALEYTYVACVLCSEIEFREKVAAKTIPSSSASYTHACIEFNLNSNIITAPFVLSENFSEKKRQKYEQRAIRRTNFNASS